MPKKYPYKKKICPFCKNKVESMDKQCSRCHRYFHPRYAVNLKRNLAIQDKFKKGIGLSALAREYQMSKANISRIVSRRYSKYGK